MVAFSLLQVGPLDLGCLERVEVVEYRYLVIARQKGIANMAANEPRTAGDQNVHGNIVGAAISLNDEPCFVPYPT